MVCISRINPVDRVVLYSSLYCLIFHAGASAQVDELVLCTPSSGGEKRPLHVSTTTQRGCVDNRA